MLENLLLLSCRSPYLDDEKVYPPLGLLKLSTSVNENMPAANVDLCDDYDLSKPEIFEPYDAIGISVMTPQREEALNILTTVKKHFPDKKVFGGGPHFKYYLDDASKQPWDNISSQDGDYAILKFMSETSPRIDTEKLKKHEWAALPKIDRKSHADFIAGYNYNLGGRRSTTMLTATGCPERCTFCEDAMTAVRWTSLDTISRELDDIKELGYGGIYIFDDIFAIALPKTRPIAEEMGKRDLIYRCNAQARYFTQWGEEFAKMLADTGCYEIAFGAETGSQKILDNINKRTKIEQNYKTVEYAKKNGIIVKAFILLGLPGEDWDTLYDTEKFVRDSGIDDFQAAVYMPYKGTQIRDAIDKGEDVDLQMTVDEVSGAYGIKGGQTAYEVRTKELSQEDLEWFRNRLVSLYKPQSHSHFFDTHLVSKVEYGS